MDPQFACRFCCRVKLQVNNDRSSTLNYFETSANTLFISICRFQKAWCVTDSKVRRQEFNVDPFERFLLGFSWFFRIRKIAKQCGWTRVNFSSIISVQTRWSRKDFRGGVYLLKLYVHVNNEESRLWHNFPAIQSTKGSQRIDEWNKHPKTCKRCYVRIASGNLSCVQCCRLYRRKFVYRLVVFRFKLL